MLAFILFILTCIIVIIMCLSTYNSFNWSLDKRRTIYVITSLRRNPYELTIQEVWTNETDAIARTKVLDNEDNARYYYITSFVLNRPQENLTNRYKGVY